MDVERIEPGLDFTQVLDRAVGSADVAVAVIGDHWLNAIDEDGRLRLEDPDDYVRHELSVALERGLRVIPVLVQHARMPTSAELPEPLRPLAHRHAIQLSEERWNRDLAELTEVLERALGHARHEVDRQPN